MTSRGRTHLSIGQWAEAIGLPPADVVGWVGCDAHASRCKRNEIVWQETDARGNRFARAALLDEIGRAEAEIAALLGYYPSPRTITETIRYPFRYHGATTANGDLKSMVTRFGHLRSVGTPTLSAIASGDDALAVTVSGNQWTATVDLGQAPAVGEWYVYPHADDLGTLKRVDHPIKPVEVSVSGTVVTISGSTWALFKPELAVNETCCDESCLLQRVELWQLQYPTCDEVALRWYGVGCDGSPCEQDERVLCARIEERQDGRIRPVAQACDGSHITVGVAPHEAAVTYRAGLPLHDDGRVQRLYADAIAFLAASRLPGTIPASTDCDDCVNGRLAELRTIPSFKTGQGEADYIGDVYRMAVSKRDLDTLPFEQPTLGAIRAWRSIQRLKQQAQTEVASYV